MRNEAHATSLEVARLILGWNGPHGDLFREMCAHAIDSARERYRAHVEGDLPAPGADAVFDALVECERQLDASPEGIRDAARRLLSVASPDAAESSDRRVSQHGASEDVALGDVPPILVVGGMRTLAPEPDDAASGGAHALHEDPPGLARVAGDDHVPRARG